MDFLSNNKFKKYLLFVISFIFIFSITFNFSFFMHDFINVYLLSGEWNYSQLGRGYEFYFRPLENFVFYIFLHSFGMNALPFRIFKAIIAAGVFCLIYYYIEKYSENRKMAFLGSLFYITSPGVLASIFLIYDFEIVMQLIILSAFYFFIDIFEKKELNFKNVVIFLFLIYLAGLTKESSKVFIGAIMIFLFLFKEKSFKIILLSCILIFFALKPGFFLGFSGSQTSNMFMTLLQWTLLDNFKIFLKNFLSLSFGVLVSILLVMPKLRINKILLFWGIWFLLTSASTLFIPMSEARYLAVQFLPFTLFSFIIIGRGFNEISFSSKITKIVRTSIIILITISILFNLTVSFKHVYGQMNFYKAIGEAHDYFENKHYNSTLSFFGGDTFFYPMIIWKNNYVARLEAINKYSNNSNLFFLEGTSKNRRGSLEKTFVTGPYCLMIYGNEKRNSSSCSVELETYFKYPQSLKLTLISLNESLMYYLNPPVGKKVSCEYLCPESSKNLEITSINITKENGRFNKILDFKVHLESHKRETQEK